MKKDACEIGVGEVTLGDLQHKQEQIEKISVSTESNQIIFIRYHFFTQLL